MLLYHYSVNRYAKLKTLAAQGKVSKEEREKAEKSHSARPGYYFDHVSFFFDPVPLKTISQYFPKDHPAWKSGNSLFQYVVDSSRIGAFQFEVVESPEKTKIYYDDSIDLETYHRLLAEILSENGYVGSGNDALEKACRKFIRTTDRYFKTIPRRPNYDEIKYKYAATVPHLMLYPESGEISYLSVKKVTVE